MARIDNLLQLATRDGFEAIVLEPGHRPRFRRNGSEVLGGRSLEPELLARLLQEVAPAVSAGRETAAPPREFDYALDGRRFRFTASLTGWRIAVAPAGAGAGAYGNGAPGNGAELPGIDGNGAHGTRAHGKRPGAGGHGAHGGAAAAGNGAHGEAPSRPPRPHTAPPPATAAPATATGEVHSLAPLLEAMLERGASDLHLSADEPPRLRIDGDLDHLPGARPLSSQRLKALFDDIAPARNREEFEATQDTDFAYEIPGARFRVNLFQDHRGAGAVIRHIPQRIPAAEELGLPESLYNLAYLSKGLVLVTGPTGSGKSTTLAAILDLINRQRRDHVITIEDPIEFVHPSKRCLVNQREVGRHTASFKRALRAALREDPDVVLVGEMRDLETVSIAIETAETGHLVFGTLHTTTAPSTIERLVDQYPGDRQGQVRMMLADSLRAVVAQTLLKKVGGGRVAVFEILICTPAVSNLVREGKIHQIPSVMQTGRAHGMVLLNDALCELVKKGLIEPKEAYLKAVYKDTLLHRLAAAGVRVDLGELSDPR